MKYLALLLFPFLSYAGDTTSDTIVIRDTICQIDTVIITDTLVVRDTIYVDDPFSTVSYINTNIRVTSYPTKLAFLAGPGLGIPYKPKAPVPFFSLGLKYTKNQILTIFTSTGLGFLYIREF